MFVQNCVALSFLKDLFALFGKVLILGFQHMVGLNA